MGSADDTGCRRIGGRGSCEDAPEDSSIGNFGIGGSVVCFIVDYDNMFNAPYLFA